jgi:hypothetical protein
VAISVRVSGQRDVAQLRSAQYGQHHTTIAMVLPLYELRMDAITLTRTLCLISNNAASEAYQKESVTTLHCRICAHCRLCKVEAGASYTSELHLLTLTATILQAISFAGTYISDVSDIHVPNTSFCPSASVSMRAEVVAKHSADSLILSDY